MEQIMIDKKRLKQYKNWFENLSFFHNNSFVVDHIEFLWDLTNYLGSSFCMYTNNKYNVEANYTKLNKKEILTLAQNFFNMHNIDLNIEELIKNNILILKENIEKETKKIYGTVYDGESNYDANNNKVPPMYKYWY